ncbi:MAG TPA: TM1802 family CRISPR-associated protein, partial [bacterium]|nr:TM1802 family CRISPR-associated protein [bacterium]
MIQAIKELGEIILQQGKKNSANLLSCVVHNPNKDGKYPKVLIAVFEQVFHDAAISLNYKEIRIEDFSKNKILKYLYRRGASQGADFTLTSKITEVDKFFKNKIMSWINKYESIGDYFVKSLCEAIKKSEHSMKKDLRNKYYEIKLQPQAKEGCLFTVGFI